MNILSESLTIGLLLSLVFGALFFYLYSRVSYAEKRVGLIENILIDIKMNQEQKPVHVLPPIPPSINFDNASFVPSPALVQQEQEEQQEQKQEHKYEQLPQLQEEVEEMYSGVLDEVHASLDLSENSVPSDSTKLSVNYESMTKEELLEVAKQKNIRVSNRPGREKLLQLIRNSELMAVPEE